MTPRNIITQHTRGWHLQQWRRPLILLAVLMTLLILFAVGTQESSARRPPVQIVLDTDAGVDDAIALAWLLEQRRYPVEVLGIVTVAGNATVENVSNNVLTVLDVANHPDIPVVMGAATPLVQPLSGSGALTHGPDGFWFAGIQNPHDLSGLPTNATAFYCNVVTENPGATLIALGPLTNLAQAVESCPDAMHSFDQIFILGGTSGQGNRTPVAEFNFWHDPEAANIVLTADLHPTLIPLETFRMFSLTQEDIEDLAREGTTVGQFVAGPLQLYAQVQTGLGGASAISPPDITAVMYALNHSLGQTQSGLVKVATGIAEEDDAHRLLRGKSIIGLDLSDRIPMIAGDAELSALAQQLYSDPNFDFDAALGEILAREPDNVQVVTDIRERRMRRLFMRYLTD